MKTCEEYILKKYLEQENVITEKDKKIKDLEAQVRTLENPISEVLEAAEKVDCVTLYKSVNVIYQLKTNTSLYDYKEKFGSSFAKGKITIEELKKALEDDKTLDKLNNKIAISSWAYSERMYQFVPATHDMFEFNINDIQYVIWGNYENMSLSRLNDFDSKDGFYYEKLKEQVLEKARKEVRETLKDIITYLERK